GVGKLHVLTSPDGQTTYTYNPHGQTDTLTLAVAGTGEALHATFRYELDRLKTITYPTAAGAAPFVLTQDYDGHGNVIGVRDHATSSAYWQLTDVDRAGRYQSEQFGKEVTTERSYFEDKPRLKS